MIYRFLTRGGTAAALAALNEVPKAREQIVETDTLRFKVGDGVTAYNSLPYVTEVDDAIVNGVTARAPSQNAVYDALALKAPLASPALTGTPTVPTATAGTNTTQAASTAFVATAVASEATARDTAIAAAVAGLSWKQRVRAATTAAGTLASSFENGDAIDGVTLATGDRILIKNQAAGAENGIYVVAASGTPTRATDADAGSELVNASVFVAEGTVNADTQWVCTNNATPTLGTTAIVFAQFGVGSGGQAAIQFKDEGGNVGSSGAITSVDFVGSGISAVVVGTALTVTASGGGGSGACLGNAYVQSTTLRSVSGSNFPFDNTIPQNTEGVALSDYDLSYTPTSSASILEIELTLGWISASAALQLTLGCFVDSVANALYATTQQLDAGGQNRQFTVRFRVAAGSTSARTYKWRWGCSTGTAYLNQGNATAFFGGAILSAHTVKEFTP